MLCRVDPFISFQSLSKILRQKLAGLLSSDDLTNLIISHDRTGQDRTGPDRRVGTVRYGTPHRPTTCTDDGIT